MAELWPKNVCPLYMDYGMIDIFLGNSEDYYLSIIVVTRIRYFNVCLEKNTISGRKMGVAPKGLGLQDPTKKLAHWVDLFGQPLTRKLVFKNFGPEPP